MGIRIAVCDDEKPIRDELIRWCICQSKIQSKDHRKFSHFWTNESLRTDNPSAGCLFTVKTEVPAQSIDVEYASQ